MAYRVQQSRHIDLDAATKLLNLKATSDVERQHILYAAIRAGDIRAINNILTHDDRLLTDKMPGKWELDIPSEKCCYKFIEGKSQDKELKEYYYPLHVAADSGQKDVCAYLLGKLLPSDLHQQPDYMEVVAEKRAQGAAIDAFYEIVYGYKKAYSERYEGDKRRDRRDGSEKRHGKGELFSKPEGYLSKEMLLYRGGFKDDLYQGLGTLYWTETGHKKYVGRFRLGKQNGQGIEFDAGGHKCYKGSFRKGERHGRGNEYAVQASTGKVVRAYKGEWQTGKKHGYGILYDHFEGLCHVFVGTFAQNEKTGFGVLYNAVERSRIEGGFCQGHLEGPCSFYTRNSATGAMTGEHWLMLRNENPNLFSRKMEQLSEPFAPPKELVPGKLSAAFLTRSLADIGIHFIPLLHTHPSPIIPRR